MRVEKADNVGFACVHDFLRLDDDERIVKLVAQAGVTPPTSSAQLRRKRYAWYATSPAPLSLVQCPQLAVSGP